MSFKDFIDLIQGKTISPWIIIFASIFILLKVFKEYIKDYLPKRSDRVDLKAKLLDSYSKSTDIVFKKELQRQSMKLMWNFGGSGNLAYALMNHPKVNNTNLTQINIISNALDNKGNKVVKQYSIIYLGFFQIIPGVILFYLGYIIIFFKGSNYFHYYAFAVNLLGYIPLPYGTLIIINSIGRFFIARKYSKLL